MLETDAPYLTPHPHRGKRNEPAYVALVCDKLAALLSASRRAQMAAASTALAAHFFGVAGHPCVVSRMSRIEGCRQRCRFGAYCTSVV